MCIGNPLYSNQASPISLLAMQRDDRYMNTHQAVNSQAISALRARTADFLKMDVTRPVSLHVPRDQKPLRRTLNRSSATMEWETNENMCLGLWELMSRS